MGRLVSFIDVGKSLDFSICNGGRDAVTERDTFRDEWGSSTGVIHHSFLRVSSGARIYTLYIPTLDFRVMNSCVSYLYLKTVM